MVFTPPTIRALQVCRVVPPGSASVEYLVIGGCPLLLETRVIG
jgi:hypothetical protein